jgi:hypothetical protein
MLRRDSRVPAPEPRPCTRPGPRTLSAWKTRAQYFAPSETDAIHRARTHSLRPCQPCTIRSAHKSSSSRGHMIPPTRSLRRLSHSYIWHARARRPRLHTGYRRIGVVRRTFRHAPPARNGTPRGVYNQMLGVRRPRAAPRLSRSEALKGSSGRRRVRAVRQWSRRCITSGCGSRYVGRCRG